ncbi:MAG TPA: prepilin-type N-terminal cleavage/methylation domain-containing protein [Candidatus Saccharimonadales bacterium]|jgi:prepilin-type N-terminal cleavage/methylation domain-containing protein|nr:prepilin-type N-terminal cleavage/methylation domain-containing protein [Candidatus Saccharimonadales bacterium]
MNRQLRQAGDTLVEVLLAMVILSVIMVGAFTLMTRGATANETALEHTQVRMQLNAQSDMLRYLRDTYVNAKAIDAVATTPAAALWQQLINDSSLVNQTAATQSSTCSPQKAAFYINKTFVDGGGADVAISYKKYNRPNNFVPSTYSQINSDGTSDGLWIEAVSSSTANPSFVDFIIEACWSPLGIGAQQHSSTLVRLYDAR